MRQPNEKLINIRRGEGGGVGKGKKDTGYLYKAFMAARVLFPVLICGATRSHRYPRATIKDSVGECYKKCHTAGRPQGIAPTIHE